MSHPSAYWSHGTTAALLETRDDDQWRLDDSTRALGHKGVAQARRILHEALAAAREHDTAA